MDNNIIVKDLVLLGGGHAHVHTLKMLGMDPVEGVRVTLVTRDLETPYSGMIPGYVAGYYTKDECHVDLVRLCGFAGVRLIHAEVCDLNVFEKVVYCKDGRPPIRYDVLSLDIGIAPVPLPGIWNSKPGTAVPSITPVKPIDSFATRWDTILQRILKLARNGGGNAPLDTRNSSPYHLRIVGGGGGGVELAFALHYRLHKELDKLGASAAKENLRVSVINRGDTLMSTHKLCVQKLITKKLKEKGIDVILGTEIVSANAPTTDALDDGNSSGGKTLISKAGAIFPFDEVIWCTQGVAQSWLKNVEGLATTADGGFIRVGPTLESVSIEDVFACGDVCHLDASPRPKAGVFAVRAGPPLTTNLRNRLLGRDREQIKWTPQQDFLGIIGIGNEEAVASKGPLGIEGPFVWKLKDKIDRLWMNMYQVLPDKEQMMAQKQKVRRKAHKQEKDEGDGGVLTLETEPEEQEGDVEVPEVARNMGAETIAMLSKAKMRCGGCGSKIGANILSRVLASVKQDIYPRVEVLAGAGDDAALVLPPPNGSKEVLVHTLDYFRSFVGDPFIFGKIAANHSLSDIHAMNGQPVTALALCVIPYGPEAQVESNLRHMLAGCLEVLKEEKCSLVGGHTSEGTETALGLSVNGLADLDKVMRKGPLESGDVIILTKALGTGTLLAADMRGKARGRWVAGAINSMLLSNRTAATILQAYGCRHCTDVTGFGFLGHLLEMLKYVTEDGAETSPSSSTVGAVLSLHAMPLLEGARACVEQGVLSTLHPQNVRCSQAIKNLEVGAKSSVYPLLFDPQTAGGLIATVRPGVADSLVQALREGGYPATTVVGRVTTRSDTSDGAPFITLEM